MRLPNKQNITQTYHSPPQAAVGIPRQGVQALAGMAQHQEVCKTRSLLLLLLQRHCQHRLLHRLLLFFLF
jgi:hypothetical protein